MRAGVVALAIMGAAASLPSSGSGAVSRFAAYSIRSLGYPWADATTLNAPTYDWGYSTCRKDIGPNCSAIPPYKKSGRVYYESDPWKYYLRNCTSYVAWRLHSLDVPTNLVVGLGYAAQWPGNAKAKGIAVGSTPQVGAAAVDPSAAPPYGHVGFVTAVNRDGTITVDEYNFFSHGNGDEWTGKPSEHGFTTYVYFGRYEKTSTASHNPFGSFDTLTTSDGRATATGWAADPDSPKAAVKVQIQVDGKAKATVAANGARADVARHYPSYGAAHGFSTGLTLSSGRHTVCAEALNAGTGANASLGCKTVTVKAAAQTTTTTATTGADVLNRVEDLWVCPSSDTNAGGTCSADYSSQLPTTDTIVCSADEFGKAGEHYAMWLTYNGHTLTRTPDSWTLGGPSWASYFSWGSLTAGAYVCGVDIGGVTVATRPFTVPVQVMNLWVCPDTDTTAGGDCNKDWSSSPLLYPNKIACSAVELHGASGQTYGMRMTYNGATIVQTPDTWTLGGPGWVSVISWTNPNGGNYSCSVTIGGTTVATTSFTVIGSTGQGQ